jgi:hypothetical protein
MWLSGQTNAGLTQGGLAEFALVPVFGAKVQSDHGRKISA